MSKKTMWVAAVCIALAAFAASGEDKGVVCQAKAVEAAVDQWKELPADYASFAALPEEYKRAVYLRLSNAERAALWQDHWQTALGAGNFTETQRELISEARSLWTGETFAALRSPDSLHYAATLQLVRDFESRLQSFFDSNEMGSLFGRLGPVSAQTVLVAEPAAALLPAARSQRVLYRPLCACNVESNDCGSGYICGTSEICVRTGGCGYMMMETCDGQCLTAPTQPPCP